MYLIPLYFLIPAAHTTNSVGMADLVTPTLVGGNLHDQLLNNSG